VETNDTDGVEPADEVIVGGNETPEITVNPDSEESATGERPVARGLKAEIQSSAEVMITR
jgi:hypothetical protein